jgi:hypothetical protein
LHVSDSSRGNLRTWLYRVYDKVLIYLLGPQIVLPSRAINSNADLRVLPEFPVSLRDDQDATHNAMIALVSEKFTRA